MAVAIDDNATYESGSGGYIQVHTLSDINCSGSNSYALFAGFNRNPAVEVTSWTCEGATPDNIKDQINTSAVGVSVKGDIISNSATTIVCNTDSYKLQAISGLALSGVDQTTPITGTPVGGQNWGTTATVSYTGTSGNMLFVFASSQHDRTFTASNCTQIHNFAHADAALGQCFAGYVTATGSSQTVGVTIDTATNWSVVVVEVKAAAAAGVTVTPSAGSLTITGYAPTVTATDNKTVTPSAGSLAITGYAPTVVATDNKTVEPSVGSLALTGYAPTVTATDNQFVTPGAGSVAITGYAPTVSFTNHQFVTPATGTLTLTGYEPTVAVSDNQAVTPGAGSLAITGYAPTISIGGNVTVTPEVGTVTITGYAPTVTYSVAARKYYIDANGNVYWVINQSIGLVEKI